jgi:hypothetical protein
MVLDEQNVLREAMSDEFDVSTLLDVDDQLSFRRPGIGLDVTASCAAATGAFSASWTCTACARTKPARRWASSSGCRTARACAACASCTARAWARRAAPPCSRARCSAGWCRKEVLAFVQARPAEGGAGALVVLLQPGKRKLF